MKKTETTRKGKIMAEKLQVYKCMVCGNIVEVLHGGAGELVCCGKPMEKLVEKTTDEGREKHVPVIEKVDGDVKVKVGSVPHPMEEKHYIEWVEILADSKRTPKAKGAFGGTKAYRQFLNPGDAPEAEFSVEADVVTAREHCSIHGLWKGE
jgi:superoxide reductase